MVTYFKLGRYDRFTNYTDAGSALTSFPDNTVVQYNSAAKGRRQVTEGNIKDWNYMMHMGTDPRAISLSCNIRTDNETTADTLSTLVYSKGEKVLYLEADKFYKCWGVDVTVSKSGVTPNHRPMNFSFICPDPRLYSDTIDSPTFDVDDATVHQLNSGTISSGSLANAGSANTDIELIITNAAAGAHITKVQFCDQKWISDGANDITQPSAETTLEVVSNDAADTTQYMVIYGVSSATDTCETIKLNGTTHVHPANDYAKIYYIQLSATCAGTVTCKSDAGATTNATITTGERSATIVPDPTDTTTYSNLITWDGDLGEGQTLKIYPYLSISKTFDQYKSLVPEVDGVNGQTDSSIAGAVSGAKEIQIEAGQTATQPRFAIKLTGCDASSAVILRHRDAWWF